MAKGSPGAEREADARLTPRLLTAHEAAELLNIPASWIYAQTRAGAIPVVRLGRCGAEGHGVWPVRGAAEVRQPRADLILRLAARPRALGRSAPPGVDRAELALDLLPVVNGSVLRYFGEDRALASIDTDAVDEYRRHLLGVVSRRTAQKTLVLLYGLLKYAKRRRWIATNPADDAERVTTRRRPEFAVLSPAEVHGLARCAATEGEAALFTVAAFSGLRMGETASSSPDDEGPRPRSRPYPRTTSRSASVADG